MPHQPISKKPKRQHIMLRMRPFLLSAGFLAIAAGAFALTLSGPWVWFGAGLWGLAGVILVACLIKSVGDPTPDPSKAQHLEQQLREIDLQCEHLQDQNWELREAEQKYRTLLNRQNDIILHLEADGAIHDANDAFGRYFDPEMKASPFSPDPADPLVSPKQAGEPLWERQIETFKGQTWFRWTETIMRTAQKNGHNTNGGMRLLIARDITAFKRVEAASEAKSRFLATISHEMRTPLNGIIGMANLLESTPLSAEQSSYNQALHQSGTALLALVNDVLDLSRIEAGKLTLRHEWTSPTRLMEDVVELLAPDAQEKGLSVASWVGQSVPDKMLIDPVRVRQILINLLGNAIKFTSTGAINLSLDCPTPPEDGEGATLLLSVRDTGPGISQDMIGRLFEEFEQADQSPARPHDGAGLGLAISRRLARMMNGDILVTSKEGKGSTFSLQLTSDWIDNHAEPVPPFAQNGSSLSASSSASTGRDDFQSAATELSGDMLVGIDLTQADQRALYSYCQDWGISFHHFSLSEWEEKGSNLSPDHVLINGAEPDKVATILGEFDPVKSGRLTRPLPRSRVILLEPGERKVIPQMRDSGITAYLVKPVRQTSLHQTLLGHPALRFGTENQTRWQTEKPAPDHASAKTTDDIHDARDEHEANHHAANQSTDRAAPTSAHILLVEDNAINALLARTILQKAGMTVTLAQSGQDALKLYDSLDHVDLALLDLHMPDMDGMALFDALSERDVARAQTVPKLAFTADVLEETRQECLNHGFADFIVKPVEPDILVSILRANLRNHGV